MKHTPVFPSCKAMVRLAAPQRPGDIQPFNVHVALLGMSVPFVLKRVPPISRAARDDAAGCDHHPTPAHCLPLLPVDHVAFRRRKIGGNLKFFHLRNADVSGVAHMSIRSRTPSETKTRRLPIPQAFFRPRLIPVPRREARRPYHTSRRCQTLSIISAPARAPRGRLGGSFSPIPTPPPSPSFLAAVPHLPPSPPVRSALSSNYVVADCRGIRLGGRYPGRVPHRHLYRYFVRAPNARERVVSHLCGEATMHAADDAP